MLTDWASAIADVEHGPTRVRDGRATGPTTVSPPQPRVGEDLVDRRVVAAGDQRHRPAPPRIRAAWSAAAS